MKQSLSQELPFVSVVIPTANRKNHLVDCLRALFEIDYPKSKLEIIVVEGSPQMGTINMVKNDFENVKLLIERRKGVSFARNIGGDAAKGEIIVFTDDDCIVDKEWLRCIVHAFNDEKVSAAGGSVTLLCPNLFPSKFSKLATLCLFSLSKTECLTELLVTANFAIRKVFNILKFDVRFGQRRRFFYKWKRMWNLR